MISLGLSTHGQVLYKERLAFLVGEWEERASNPVRARMMQDLRGQPRCDNRREKNVRESWRS